ITGLGRNTNQGSSLLIMMIMGGGLVSLFQGWLADVTTVHMSFIVGVACCAYLAFYAARTPGILRRQGTALDKRTAGGGGHGAAGRGAATIGRGPPGPAQRCRHWTRRALRLEARSASSGASTPPAGAGIWPP